MITRQELLNAVRQALENPEVNFESNTENTEGWDSLSQLGIFSLLDDITSGKSSDIQDMSTCKSIQELIDKFKLANLITD